MIRRWIPMLGVAVVQAFGCGPSTLGDGNGNQANGEVRELASDVGGTICEEGGAKVVGKINEKYRALGGCESFLGKPLHDEQKTPDGVGRYSVFAEGSIYWHPSIGTAFEVHGAIREAWRVEHWEAGRLGYPISDERVIDGRHQSDFVHGNITWIDGKTEVHVTDTSGEATYYYFVSGGACGVPTPPDRLIAAINDEQYSKANCGRCAMVTGPNGSVVVKIVDKCPGCDSGDLDLSEQAFKKIASTSAGRIKIGWHFVDCK